MRHGPCPLRSSQSVEHRQQIKHWFCLLGSTFFYSETPFYLCRAAVHIPTQMKRQVKETCLGGAQNGAGDCKPPILTRQPSPVEFPSWARGREVQPIRAVGAEAHLLRSTPRDPSEKQKQNHWHAIPSGCVCTTGCRGSSEEVASSSWPSELQPELGQAGPTPELSFDF